MRKLLEEAAAQREELPARQGVQLWEVVQPVITESLRRHLPRWAARLAAAYRNPQFQALLLEIPPYITARPPVT